MLPSLVRPGQLFSQHSLGTFVRCPRRFLLKYIDRQPWPMPQDSEPAAYEAQLARGRVFHQWMVRRVLGVPMADIVACCDDPDLQRWWRAAGSFPWDALPTGQREPELPVVVALGDYRLYARYDLLALDPDGDALILDWKSLEARPSPQVLESRLQTRIYLYTLVTAGKVLSGACPIAPAQASMLYWFANFPDRTAVIHYGSRQYAEDGERLHALVERIAGLERDEFTMTDDYRQCVRCTYRTLCHAGPPEQVPTGSHAGWLDEDLAASLDLDTVPDLEY